MKQLQIYTEKHLLQIRQLAKMQKDTLFSMQVVAKVLPFRVNNHVIEELIDWDNVPNDPIYQLTFPQAGMLDMESFNAVANVLSTTPDDKLVLAEVVNSVRSFLNPHPADQMTLNVPYQDGILIEGIQHKYKETVLFFPHQGQTCHAYCTFCFRWPQFIGDKSLMFAAKQNKELLNYLKKHKEVSDLLVTGGDPMIMKTNKIYDLLLPLLHNDYEHVQTIRIGTKALTYWPYRFTTDEDADDLLRLIETLSNHGKHVAIMAHLNHWREIDNPVAELAIKKLRSAGAVIRSQGPILKHINDSATVWKKNWEQQVRLGIIPYYTFVERDTGAKNYFEISLVRAYEIYQNAFQQVSGLAKTARGPSMSCSPGKVEIQGITHVDGEKVFVLRLIQARNPKWIEQPFFAKYNAKATWYNHLKPHKGEKFFFEENEYLKNVSEEFIKSPTLVVNTKHLSTNPARNKAIDANYGS